MQIHTNGARFGVRGYMGHAKSIIRTRMIVKIQKKQGKFKSLPEIISMCTFNIAGLEDQFFILSTRLEVNTIPFYKRAFSDAIERMALENFSSDEASRSPLLSGFSFLPSLFVTVSY